jgi:hypothetical protein
VRFAVLPQRTHWQPSRSITRARTFRHSLLVQNFTCGRAFRLRFTTRRCAASFGQRSRSGYAWPHLGQSRIIKSLSPPTRHYRLRRVVVGFGYEPDPGSPTEPREAAAVTE